MSDTITVTLTGPAAEAVEGLVARGDYPSAEAAVADAVLQLADEGDNFPALWHEEIERRVKAFEAAPERVSDLAAVRRRVLGEDDAGG